jgi:hypothetical protein
MGRAATRKLTLRQLTLVTSLALPPRPVCLFFRQNHYNNEAKVELLDLTLRHLSPLSLSRSPLVAVLLLLPV